MSERSTNIILGEFMRELDNGCVNIGNFETNAKWISDLRNRAFSHYIAYAAQAGGLAEAADKMYGGKVGEKGLRDESKLLAGYIRGVAELPEGGAERYYDLENFIGQPLDGEKMDKAAAERLFRDYMTGLSKKSDVKIDANRYDVYDPYKVDFSSSENKPLNRYTAEL
ncbi:MAG: hypothetical protein LBG87_06160, partial [Spirochaetaceae bacterium]|jgi:hypothetical protein|nr:hypothetical protein [Spirochaetaceae bacterium]